jgi:DNA polymerase/3'-5' exonuclease PolX
VSAGIAIGHAAALAIAEGLVNDLRPACERIEIAGSLRRGKPQVHDIEIVAVPRIEQVAVGLLSDVTESIDRLELLVAAMLADGVLERRPVENHRADGSIDVQFKLGPAFKALLCLRVPLDLFIVRPPATWGVIFGLRTGPGDWNTRLVDECKAIGRRVAGGQVEAWSGALGRWEAVPTPEERDFFRALGQPWVEPPERHASRVAIRRDIAVPA